MAIAALALRLATVYMLRGQTIAGARVMDSAIAPIDQRVASERDPALVVYTDDYSAPGDGRVADIDQASLQVVVELVVAKQVEHDGEIVVTVPETDGGFELEIDLLERQIEGVRKQGTSTWAKLWRALVLNLRKTESQRGAGSKDGVRFAARQVVWTVQPLAEPDFGAPAQGVWRQFLDAVEAEPDLTALAPLLDAAIQGEALPDWRIAQAQQALTDDGIRGIGVAPVFDAAPDEAAPSFDRLTLAGDDGDRIIEPEA